MSSSSETKVLTFAIFQTCPFSILCLPSMVLVKNGLLTILMHLFFCDFLQVCQEATFLCDFLSATQDSSLDMAPELMRAVCNVVCSLCFKSGYRRGDEEFETMLQYNKGIVDTVAKDCLVDIFPWLQVGAKIFILFILKQKILFFSTGVS